MNKADIQKILRDKREELVEEISLTGGLWDCLLSAGIVTDREKEKIEVCIC